MINDDGSAIDSITYSVLELDSRNGPRNLRSAVIDGANPSMSVRKSTSRPFRPGVMPMAKMAAKSAGHLPATAVSWSG